MNRPVTDMIESPLAIRARIRALSEELTLARRLLTLSIKINADPNYATARPAEVAPRGELTHAG